MALGNYSYNAMCPLVNKNPLQCALEEHCRGYVYREEPPVPLFVMIVVDIIAVLVCFFLYEHYSNLYYELTRIPPKEIEAHERAVKLSKSIKKCGKSANDDCIDDIIPMLPTDPQAIQKLKMACLKYKRNYRAGSPHPKRFLKA